MHLPLGKAVANMNVLRGIVDGKYLCPLGKVSVLNVLLRCMLVIVFLNGEISGCSLEEAAGESFFIGLDFDVPANGGSRSMDFSSAVQYFFFYCE